MWKLSSDNRCITHIVRVSVQTKSAYIYIPIAFGLPATVPCYFVVHELDKQKTNCLGARKHTCDVDMRRAYAIGIRNTIEETLKVHMYWRNVQGLRVKAFVCCLLLNVC